MFSRSVIVIVTADVQVVENFGPELRLLFKLHEIWFVDSQGNYYNCHQTSDFKAKALKSDVWWQQL